MALTGEGTRRATNSGAGLGRWRLPGVLVLVWVVLGLAVAGSLAGATRLDPARPTEAPTALTGRPQMEVFTDREGLRQNSIEAIATDDQGYVWIATQDGAMRYDGRVWTAVDMPTPRRSNWVTAMVLTRGGPRWFGTSNAGIARWDGRWTVYDTSAGLPSDSIFALVEGAGTLWAGTGQGPARWTGTRWQALPGTQPWSHGAVRALLVRGTPEDPEVWVGADGGLGHLLHGGWQWLGSAGGLPSPMVTALLEEAGTGQARGLWVGTQGGLAQGKPGHWNVFGTPGLLPHPAVSCLAHSVSHEGRPVLWVGTEGGLLRWEGARVQVWGRAQGLHNPLVRSLMVQESASGRETVWAGTFGGLVRFRGGTWASLGIQDGLQDPMVLSLHEDPRTGTLWFGTFHGLVSHQGGHWTSYGPSQGLPSVAIFALAGDAGDGSLWVGTRGQGLFHLSGGRAQPVPGLPKAFVYALYATRDAAGTAELWVGTRKGLSRWRQGTWTHFGGRHSVPAALVSSITGIRMPGGGTQLWVGTRGAGLGVLEKGRRDFTWFNTDRGLVDDRVMHLLATEEEGQPAVWVSTQGGLQLFRTSPPGPTKRVFDQASDPALPGDMVYTAQRGPDGSLYAFTNRGVWRMKPRPGGGVDTETFTTGDGLPSNGCVQGASLVDSRGRIWAGTVMGVAILDPTTRLANALPKPLYLGEAKTGERMLDAKGPWQLSWRSPNLNVRFSLLSYHREGDTRFRSQLVGLEAEPTPWLESSEREFVSLPPGHYHLRFWGRDYAGRVSGPVDIPLSVQAPPWLRWWALLLEAALFLAAGVGILRWRVRRLRRLNVELAERVHAATGEVRRQNESLARVNQHLGRLNQEKSNMLGIAAHDLRNPLNSISLQAEVMLRQQASSEAAAPAHRILKLGQGMALLIERLLNSSRIDEGQLSLHMQGVAPGLLLHEVAERHQAAAVAKGLAVVVEVPQEGVPELLADPFHLMEVMDNLVGNALKFMPKGPPQRKVVLRARPGVIEVQDEGPGFTEEDRAHAFERFRRLSAKPTAGEGSTGLGLSIAKSLVEAMGGEIELASESGQGALFRIHLGTP